MEHTITFTNVELAALSEEIKQFLLEKLPVLVKYRFSDLFEKVSAAVKPYIDIRNEAILAIAPDGSIAMYTTKDNKRTINPLWEELMNVKLKDVNEIKVDIAFKKLPLSLIANLETDNYYPFIYRLFEDTEK